ncbi:hypothetical protein [Pectobacterium brasiliense]|uniref:hypothetical protein n=1 Tax=Pectobacterium brasiliense TaxID=180957 RepID=UPI0019693442|nr:hypothetical protein [Pectobacterium brasiliense]MBN3262955.1 hypothetical protein [Pectobacterium brasiliense]
MTIPNVTPLDLAFGLVTSGFVVYAVYFLFFHKSVEVKVEHIDSTEPKRVEKFNSEENEYTNYDNAAAIHQRVNIGFYQHLLSEFSDALQKEGYRLTRDRDESIMLPMRDLAKLAESFMRARELYLAPNQKDSDLTSTLEDYMSSGYAIGWVMWMINASVSEGWYIAVLDVDAA